MTNFEIRKGKVYLGDNSTIEIIGRGMYGNLQCIVCPKISSNLISISSLTKNNNYVVLFFDNTALILSPIYKPNSNRISKFRIVTSATRDPFDNLYRIKDLTVFLNEPINYQTNCNNPQPLLTASANRARVVQSIPSITLNKTNSSIDDNLPNHHPTTTPSSATEQLISSDKEDKINTVDQLFPVVAPQIVINEPVGTALNADAVNEPSTTIIKGSTRTQLKASRYGLNLLEWLHLRLGHADPELIKWMVRHQEADVGTFVPFFAKGVAYLHPHERYNYDAKTKALHDRSREVRCVGYAFNGHKLNQAENPVTYVKDSYIIYLPDQDAIRVRHDCYFQSYTDQDGKDFQIGGVIETPQNVDSINQDISNDKELFESYDKAFGIWKTHEWTGIDQKLIENKSLPDQPLYSLAPTIINNSDHSTTNDEDIPLPISIAIDDYGYVKPSASQSSIISYQQYSRN